MTTGSAKPLSFVEGWPILQEEAIDKLIHLVEGNSSNQFNSEEYMRIYTTIYNMCDKNNRAGPEALKLYSQYKKTIEDYVSSKVLPSIQGKEDAILLQELLKRWNNHKTMTWWLLRFFYYLERCLIPKTRLPTIQETSYLVFYELVYGEMNDRVRDAVISLVEECLKNEEARSQSYLRYGTKHKLLGVVEYELLTVHASKLEEKKQINLAADA
ncbi:cullin-1-like isoform X1 [Nicotiana tabacum]|uniref:Cullin-1-like isoform X1 n=1 Tax=Nicotiana tabacum TaxID=4097 RepID=A0AC58U7U7_TOBAC